MATVAEMTERHSTRDDVELDGCAIDMSVHPVPDAELPYVVLAGELEGVAARQRIEEYSRVLGGAR